jgi:MFS family permease
MQTARVERPPDESTDRPFSLRAIAVPVYGPSLLFGIGSGAVLPVVALSARDLGASFGVAALVVGLQGAGLLIGDLPAGALAARIGERRAMIGAAVLTAAAMVACLLAPSLPVLAAGILASGLASAVWGLARQSYLTEAVPIGMRARALSTLAGLTRVGTFVGPFLGAALAGVAGTDAGYLLNLGAAALAAAILLVLPEPGTGPHGARGPRPSLAAVVRGHRHVLMTLGLAALMVMAVRQTRQSVLPLWCDHIGLDAAQTSLIFGLSGAVDMLLFYPAGSLMDRFGPASIGIPSMLVLAASYAVLPLAETVPWVIAVAVLMGIGNGLGAGLVLTIGANASPPVGRQAFLGAWRLVSDLGNASGPLAVSAVAAVTSLAAASVAMGGVGVLAAAVLWRWASGARITREPRQPP